jgi:hypothetical protein
MSDTTQHRLSRRQALTGLAVLGGGSLAGCSSVFGSGETVLGRIEVINSSFVRNRIRLMVDRDGGTAAESDDETLLDRTMSLAGLDAEDGTCGRVIEGLWSETPGQYTVRAVHVDDAGNRETGDWEYTVTREDYETYYGDSNDDPGCIGAVVKVGSRAGAENAPIGIGPIAMEHPCGTP